MEYEVDTAPPMTEEDVQNPHRNADHEDSTRDRDIKDEEDEEEDEDEEELQFVLNTEDVGKGESTGNFLKKPSFVRNTNSGRTAPFGFNKQSSTQANQLNQSQGQLPQIVSGASVVIAGTVHPVNYHLYNALVGGYVANQKSALELEEIEDKQWRKPGADITDYFNYGFSEDTWKSYTAKQVQLRLEQSMQSKIKVWTSAHEQPQANPDMPPELLALSGSGPSPRMRPMQTQAIPVVGGNSPPMSQNMTPSWDRPSSSQPEHRRRPRESDDSVIQVLASAEEGGRPGSSGPDGSEFPGFPPGMRPPFPGGMPPMGMPMPMPPGYDRGFPPRGRDDRERRFPASDRPPSERDFFDEHSERDRDERHRRDEERRREDYDRRRERDDRDRRDREREREKEASSSSSSRDRESSSSRRERDREDDHKRHKRDDEERKRRRDH